MHNGKRFWAYIIIKFIVLESIEKGKLLGKYNVWKMYLFLLNFILILNFIFFCFKLITIHYQTQKQLRADVSKYRPEVYKSEKSKILKKIHKVALGKPLT